jgi:hypothetical protein
MDLDKECRMIGADGVQGQFSSDEEEQEDGNNQDTESILSEGSPIGKMSTSTSPNPSEGPRIL